MRFLAYRLSKKEVEDKVRLEVPSLNNKKNNEVENDEIYKDSQEKKDRLINDEEIDIGIEPKKDLKKK